MSIHWPILRRLIASPTAVAATDDVRTWKRVEVLIAAALLADRLAETSRSRTVGALLPTGAFFPIAALASWMLGRVVTPLNYLLKPAELQYVVDDCGCDTIVAVQPMLDYLGAAPKGPSILRLEDVNFRTMPEPRWPSLRGCFGSRDELAVLLYTSGTSGKPKGVMLSHENISANIRQCVEWAKFGERDVILGVLPQFHSFGFTVLTMLPLTVGCRAVYAAKFVPANIIRLLRQHRPTAFIAIPSMYNALLSVKGAEPEDFASLRYIVSGGEPLPRPVAAKFHERFGVRICEGYGLTETSPVTNWCRPWEYRLGSVGQPMPRVIQRIVDPGTQRDLGPNQDGEVRIGGPQLMMGYFNLPQETAAAFDERGHLRTGDMGRFDGDGRLSITGRIKEMLIIAGENVFPREIEEALDAHPAVAGSGVVGRPDPVRVEIPVAFVELREGMTATEAELRAFCRGKIAPYKTPSEVRIVPALPRSGTGKVLRRALKEIIEAEVKKEEALPS
ncbi:MAG: AMP-binding protein [Phycisphaerales bacterium]|nr:AMP-binding protein [Phycisphaerales bacterium]